MIIVLSGSFKSGKHTLARFLNEKYNFEIIDMIDVIREELKLDSLSLEALDKILSSNNFNNIKCLEDNLELWVKVISQTIEELRPKWS